MNIVGDQLLGFLEHVSKPYPGRTPLPYCRSGETVCMVDQSLTFRFLGRTFDMPNEVA
jgi:hypothetical protein